MELIPNWQNLRLRCYFCGETRSVKYNIAIPDKSAEDGVVSVPSCNECALLFAGHYHIGGKDE